MHITQCTPQKPIIGVPSFVLLSSRRPISYPLSLPRLQISTTSIHNSSPRLTHGRVFETVLGISFCAWSILFATLWIVSIFMPMEQNKIASDDSKSGGISPSPKAFAERTNVAFQNKVSAIQQSPWRRTRPIATRRWWLFSFVLIGIHHANKSHALFVRPPSELRPYPDLHLATADRLGVPYNGLAVDAGKAASLPGFALSLNADFGPLDQNTFEALLKYYGVWSETKSRVTWKEGRTYTLLDFLPPLLQAVHGLHFQSSRTNVKGLPSIVGSQKIKKYTEQEVLLTSNCWGFAWEVLFQADNADTSAMTISTADPTSAWRAFTGPGFDLIQSSRTRPDLLHDAALRNKKIKAGDVLLIWHTNPSTVSGTDLYLDHVATCLDDDVYYEKSGSGDKVPFRVSTWQMITANFPPNVFFWEWRRLVRNNPLSPNVYGSLPRLQPATEIFGVDAQVGALSSSTNKKRSFLRDRFSIFSELRQDVAQRISLQTDLGGGVMVESQVYTGIVVLEDLVFDSKTGRVSLPKSAFVPDWYRMVQDMFLKNPYNM
jgi:hypothetical protein